MKLMVYLFLLSMLLRSQIALADKWSFASPPGAKVEWVTSNASFNSINIKGRHFTTKGTMESVLQFYRNLWQENFAEIDYGPWRMISRKEDELMYTVQVQTLPSGKGAFGILGVSDIAEKLKNSDFEEQAKNFPKMHGSIVSSEMKMNDPGKKGKVILLSNEYSLASNVTYYKNYYQSRDWTVQADKSIGFNTPHTLVFTKGREMVNLVIARGSGTTNVVANIVNKGVLNW